jgi:menaquinone-specific isochorismate synthase
VESGRGTEGQRPPDRLAARTIRVADPGDLLSRLPGLAPLAWVRRGDGLVGWGETARITLPAGEDRFTAGEKWLRELFEGARVEDQVGLPGCGPVAFGSFTFDSASDGSVLVVPATVLARRGTDCWLTAIGPDPLPAGPGPLPAALGTLRDASPSTASAPAGKLARAAANAEVRWHDGSLAAPAWEEAVAAAVAQIRAGPLRKVVLARDLYAHAAAPIDVRSVLRRLAARYPGCYTFACGGLVGATPELLIRRQDGEISSLVLAGTAPRGAGRAQDERIGAALLASAKDTEEHQYAVAGVQATLAPLCGRIAVDPAPSLLKLANVQHLATAVAGTLAPGRDGPGPSALALAAALHPTGAVCGTPAEAAMDLIRELEGMDRGRYAGPAGWMDAQGNGEWGIALRCAEIGGRWARLFAGCGIVAGSEPAAELAEAQAKFRPMQDAIEG